MGVKTLYEYFYKLAYGDKGTDKATLVNDCLDVADAEIKANKDAKHSQNTDTHLGTVDANINMNTHKLTSLAVPSVNGDSVRATTKITETNLESAIDHKDLTDDPHSVTKTQVGLSNVENLKVKLDATSAPTVNNDVDEGYTVGSRWVDVTNDKEYICLNNTDGAAVWTETTSVGGGLDNIVEDVTPQLGAHLDTNDFGIAFPATQAPDAGANVLDDYEEGSWTMGIAFGGGVTGITYDINTGYYTKIGNIVIISGRIQLTSKGTDTGTAKITGLPFTVVNNLAGQSAVSLLLNKITFANQYVGATVINDNEMSLEEITEAGVLTSLTNADFADDSMIIVNCTYRVE